MKSQTSKKRASVARPPSAMAHRPSSAAIDPAACVLALERVLRGQIDGYTKLLVIIERQCEAIRTADPAALETAAREQDALVRALATIDAQRTQLLALGFREDSARREATLSDVLDQAKADGESRSRLLSLAADLRAKVQAAKRAGAIVRDAANALARHMAGIQQTVHSALSRARVYERRGRLNLGSSMPATLDMKS